MRFANFAVSWASLLLSAMLPFNSLGGAPEMVAPADGAVVSLLTDSQKEFAGMAGRERRAKFSDRTFRAKSMGLPAGSYGSVPSRPSWPRPVRLEWRRTGEPVKVTVTDAACGATVFEGSTADSAVYLSNLKTGVSYKWTLAGPGGSVSRTFRTEESPLRLLRVPGADNVRDLGGKKVPGGVIRQGLLFRSGSLDGVTSSAEAAIAEFGIRTDIDLRGKDELGGRESSPLGGGVSWRNIPFAAYGAMHSAKGKEAFASVFRILLNETNYPAVFHGRDGRDRTGSLSFVLLGLLGCGADDLALDWEASGFKYRNVSWNHALCDSLAESFFKYYGAASTLQENMMKYVLDCGFTVEDIEKFQSIMIERAAPAEDAAEEQ